VFRQTKENFNQYLLGQFDAGYSPYGSLWIDRIEGFAYHLYRIRNLGPGDVASAITQRAKKLSLVPGAV
jgi:hypothetical protein